MRKIRKSRFLLPSVAATLAASALWVLILAAIPRLHEALHDDADEPGHECAITMFERGACDDVPPAPLVSGARALQHAPLPQIRSQEVAGLFLVTCVLEHAPPFFS